jgi:diguanylate cyclase (GGDEF)-like protein
MIEYWSDKEGRDLHGLLEEAAGDIVLKLDAKGFIVHASANAAELGFDPAEALLMPHISELAERDHVRAVDEFASGVLASTSGAHSYEFPITHSHIGETCASGEPCADIGQMRWYRLTLRPALDDAGVVNGAIGLLRSVQHLRVLERELHARSVTDPLTGLANRHAFCACIAGHLSESAAPMLVVFSIDRMRAIFMQYGQDTIDEFLWSFARFLETMTRPGQELGQIDSERFGVVLPDTSERAAREWAEDVLHTFSALALPSSAGRAPAFSASAGIARIEDSVDCTLRQAELGLMMARAAGGMQVGRAVAHQPLPHYGEQVVQVRADQGFGVALGSR